MHRQSRVCTINAYVLPPGSLTSIRTIDAELPTDLSTQAVVTTNGIYLQTDAIQIPMLCMPKSLHTAAVWCCLEQHTSISRLKATQIESLLMAINCVDHAIGVASRSVKEVPFTRQRLICPAIRGGVCC